jgi:hypothetical protein
MFDEARYRAGAYAVSPRAGLATPSGDLRRPATVWLLGVATLGLYWFLWYHRATRELRDFDPEIKVRPALCVIAVTLGALAVVPAVVSLYNTGCRIAQAQRRAGLLSSASGFTGLLLTVPFGLTPFYYQAHLNAVWIARN